MDTGSMTPDLQSAPPPEQQSAMMADMATPQGQGGGTQNVRPAAPAAPPSPKASIFHSIMEVLGGGDREKYSVDPNTGTMTKTRVPQTTGQLAKGILAGALTGLIAGAGERGPGAEARAFAKGGEAVMGQRQNMDLQARQQAEQDYERQQKQLVTKAQIFEANSRAALNIQQAEKLGDERMDSYIGYLKPIYSAAQKEGRVVDDQVTQQEALDGIQNGKYNPGEDMFVPIARVPRTNPDGTPGTGSELVGAMVKDAPFKFSDHPEFPTKQAIQYGFIQGGTPAQGASIKSSRANVIAQNVQMVDNAKDELNLVHKKLGTAADAMPNFDEAIKTPGMPKALQVFQSYVNASKGFDPAEAINLMSKEKQDPKTGQLMQNPDARYVPLVYQAFGGQAVLDKYAKVTGKTPEMSIQKAIEIRAKQAAGTKVDPDELAMANSVYQQNVNLAGAKTGASETAKAEVEEEFQKKQNEILQVPENFDIPPDSDRMPTAQLRKNLESQGVKIPDNFAALVAIAQGRQKLSTLPQKTYKGRSDITAQNGSTFINQFINPNYEEGMFEARQHLMKQLADTKAQGGAGGSLLALGTASQHLELLAAAADALKNGKLNDLNHIAQAVKARTGNSAPIVFQAIADRVNEEVTKVTSGGVPHEAELTRNRETLARDQSPNQIHDVIKSYIDLMGGRADEIIDKAQRYHVPEYMYQVSPKTKEVFKRYGADYSWLSPKNKSTENVQTPTKPGAINWDKFSKAE